MKAEFTQEEFERDFDEIMERVEQGLSPILIRAADGNDVVIMSWAHYKQTRSAEEIALTEAAIQKREMHEGEERYFRGSYLRREEPKSREAVRGKGLSDFLREEKDRERPE